LRGADGLLNQVLGVVGGTLLPKREPLVTS
jgi:hypothetical protein